jgi:hypothetical protein
MAHIETSVIDSMQERLIKALSACLPDEGMGLILVDKDWGCRVSDDVQYDWLIQDRSLIQDVICRIDDGEEPAWTCMEGVFVFGVHLLTPCCDYGYAMVVLSPRNHEALFQNWDLVECMLHQMQCIAGLLEDRDHQIIL